MHQFTIPDFLPKRLNTQKLKEHCIHFIAQIRPDPAPSDFFFFGYLKGKSRGTSFIANFLGVL
jgi:hypothetical protein